MYRENCVSSQITDVLTQVPVTDFGNGVFAAVTKLWLSGEEGPKLQL